MKTIKCRTCKICMYFDINPWGNVRRLYCTKCGWLHEWRDRSALFDVQVSIAGLKDEEWMALGCPSLTNC